jgi:CDP-glucose 4,6-dehydratase
MQRVVNASFWRGKRVFITGHTGFKGAWLSIWLASMGAKIGGFSLAAPSQPSLFQLADVAAYADSSVHGDIRDAQALQTALVDFRPDIVMHLAAQALVLPSFVDPAATFATNVQGTVHLLDAVRHCPTVRVAMVITSDKCYDNREWHWGYRENDPMGGKDPYSASKGCAELVVSSYRSSFFSPDTHPQHGVTLVSARAGNVIGGGDWAQYRLIPDLVRGVLSHQPVLIRNPLATRPWQHVLEPLSGYLCLAESAWEQGPAVSDGWNFGPADSAACSVGWIADRFAQLWGLPASDVWTTDQRSFPKECTFLKLDISKAAACLNWQPRWRVEECLDRVVSWYGQQAAGRDAYGLVLADIAAYMGQSDIG